MRVIARARAFSLVELLVVIAIIAVLTAILLPVVGGARAAARRAATQSLLTDYTTSANRFANDNADRMPGYFSEQEMGSSDNYNGGEPFLSASENAMLDLAGQGAIWNDLEDDPPSNFSEVGPFEDGDDRNIFVNPDLIGADDGAYFSPGDGFFLQLEHLRGQIAPNSRVRIPDVVDAFGNPILVWNQDLGGRGSIDPDNNAEAVYLQFARADSDDADAWFYLYSNASFLAPGSIGTSGRNQAVDPFGEASTSGIGLWTAGTDFEEQSRTLTAVLGSPAYWVAEAGLTLDDASFDEIFPARPRGRFIVQSAGQNGLYLGSDEQGWGTNAVATSTEFHLDFGISYKSQSDARYTLEDGGFTSVDLLEGFDDVISTSGN
ncbi:MAG: type II secretion system protein [Planctomycetota bacterium]